MINKQKALDLLREINSIGVGRIATALSEMLKAKVELNFPEAEFVSFKSLLLKLDLGSTFFIIETNLEGDISGRLSFLLHIEDARALCSGLLGKPPQELNPSDPLFQSALRETVNIFGGVYTEVLAEMTHLNIFYNLPFLNLGSKEVYLGSIPEQFNIPELMFYVNTVVNVENISFKGTLLFLLDYDSIKKLFEALDQVELVLWLEVMKNKVQKINLNKGKEQAPGLPDINYL